jgi:pimeloyl-ACP methyl ester carboxylesterase/uncharacterized protein (DUF952 family)
MSRTAPSAETLTLRLPHEIEVRVAGHLQPDRPALVMLHHGLGSASSWRDLPDRLAAATGMPAVAYSRRGYGQSAAASAPPWPPGFMHTEAEGDLPGLLAALGIRQPILFGHSDGASIALIYAGSRLEPAPLGAVLLAPHVMVEPVTLTGARRAAADFEAGGLRASLQRHHRDAEATFRGWNETWLAEEFRGWNIEPSVSSVRCPLLVVQGLADAYGSLAQVTSIEERAPEPVETLLIAGCGHAPERERPDTVVDATAAFVAELADHARRSPRHVYHLTGAERLYTGLDADAFRPDHLAAEGFCHCTWSPATLLAVADDLFTDIDPVVLRIDPTRLTAKLRFEAPAPIGGGIEHLRFTRSFPHLYGPIDRAAIRQAGRIERFVDRRVWPRELVPLDSVLERLR